MKIRLPCPRYECFFYDDFGFEIPLFNAKNYRLLHLLYSVSVRYILYNSSTIKLANEILI